MWISLGVVAIVGVYLATRLSYARRFPYFFDEGTYASFAAQGADSLDQLFVSLTIAREPLQIWLSIVWIKLGIDPLLAGRLVSVSAGLATVGVVGLIGRRLGGDAVGWVAAALCVVVPFFVVHDLDSAFVPSHLTGDITAGPSGRELALAVNGRIVGVAPSFELTDSDSEQFSVLVPETAFHNGRNSVDVLWVKRGGSAPSLQRIGGTG